MSQKKYIGGEAEWEEVHQPFELNYHRRPNFRWPEQVSLWNDQWSSVFGFAGLTPDSFSTENLLDMGCGSKPALEWFNSGEKWYLDPLLDEFRDIPQVKGYWDRMDTSRLIAKPGEEFIPMLEGHFDFILCWNALDHAYDAIAVLRNMHRYVKPGGKILLGTDIGESPHLGHPGIGSRAKFMETIHELFDVELESTRGFKFCRQRAFMLRRKLSEKDKYDGIYASPLTHRGYGHSNHGARAMPIVLEAQSICDIGCGHNEFVRGLKAKKPDLTAVGVDFSCPSADINARATALPFESKQWDMLTSFDMLEHLLPSEVAPALREFSRVSKRFVFSICYRPSVILWKGENLHPTVQPESWWISEIEKAGGTNIVKKGSYLCGEWRTEKSRKLTVAMLTYDDFDGVYFTIQNIRLAHPEVLDEVEFLILDNNPDSVHGKAVASLCKWVTEPVHYVPVTDAKGTSLRDRVFSLARTPVVLCVDCHVLLAPGSLRKLIDCEEFESPNLLQGPMLYDSMKVGATHMEPVWRDGMYGIWAVDARGVSGDTSFEIPAHGLGLFACRKDAWLGFNPSFSGFGGEECYIHEKFRRAGRKTLCLPWLRWLHRFPRPSGVPYPIKWDDRIRNYLIGHTELGLDTAPIIEHFRGILGKGTLDRILQNVSFDSIQSPS